MNFPVEELCSFLERADKAVQNAVRNSKRFTKVDRYAVIERDLLQHVLRSSEIHFYGSRVIGLANHYSNLNIFVELDDETYFEGLARSRQQEAIKSLKKLLQRDPDWAVEIALLESTVPVLRCIYLPKHLKCDITFNSGIGVHNAELLTHLFDIQPEARKLLHFIRIWLNICLSIGKNFSRYQLQVLLVFYLQSCNALPSVWQMQRNVRRCHIQEWKVQFNKRRDIFDYHCLPMGYFMKYAVGFFKFYAKFDFTNEVVFPYLGCSVEKANYPRQPALQRFRGDVSQFKWEKPMAMAGFLTVDYNISWDVGKERLKRFQQTCSTSYQLLLNNA